MAPGTAQPDDVPAGLHVGFTVVLRGYDRAAVDELVDRCGKSLVSERPDARASLREALRSRRFRVVLRGYDRAQVDRWLDDMLQRLG